MSVTQSQIDAGGRDLKQAWVTWLRRLKARVDRVRARMASLDPVLLLRADGSRCVWVGNAQTEADAGSKTPNFVAVEIPDDLLLRRSLVLPKMSPSDSKEALLLEARSNSPFAPEDMAWGSAMRESDGGYRRADIVIASRRHISEFIQKKWPDILGGDQPEVWAVAGLPVPVVITGYGEQRRLRHAQTQQLWDWFLLSIACVLVLLAAMTPTVQLQFRAREAADAFQATMKRVAPLVRKRDELAVLNDRLRALDTAVADRIDPAQVLEYLTQILPDDTHLYALDIRKEKITASGHTVDASNLLQKLSSDPRLKDVRSPTAVTHVPGATKEAFTVEFTMELKQAAVGPSPAAAGAANAAPVAAVGPAAASAAALPASAAASPAANAVAAVPGAAAPKSAPAKPGSSPFVIGGAVR